MNQYRINVMIVDDDADDQDELKEAIGHLVSNVCFTTASDGIDCIRQLKEGFQPDLILLDLNMPLKNGIECLRDINSLRLAKDVPIIIHSTSHQLKDIMQCSELGARFYVVKPSSFKALLHSLERVVYLLGRSLQEQVKKENFVIRQPKMVAA